ncbi:Insulinoma-associated protein 1 [Eumeta japonica]|uniref:Insulinoma-associated protein 1 n=1 Tax=Eumeta variegata TaxID=151549 RepID=A0A4C1XR07_EUMVA|nr:Insulinoma-associated protein 1 [Eumeta japonica]
MPTSRQVFNCPANLASHRRWHKPRTAAVGRRREQPPPEPSGRFTCQRCGKVFRRQAYLRKHLIAHDQSDDSEKEPSAFRQVAADYQTYQTEALRDGNYNTFWSKIPVSQDANWEGVPARCPSSCSSEDSRSLDVTGSEGEGEGEGEEDG